MKILSVILCAGLLAGCAGTHPKGTAGYDEFDDVKVEQMVGNNVSPKTFARSVLCLNARRETRQLTTLSTPIITSVTNQAITAVTNQTITLSTNLLYTVMTNSTVTPTNPTPASTPAVADAAAPAAPAAPGIPAAEGNTVIIVTNVPQITLSTNLTVSVANNSSGTRTPSQLTANNQLIRTFNNQFTATTNNYSVALMTNIVITGETNLVVNYVTNSTVVSATNIVMTPTNGVAYEYFLCTELIPPPEFTPQFQGESLILLVDGARYGFSQGQSGTAYVARKGYISALYRVSPDVLVAIANAQDVRVRLKGVNSAVERNMSSGSLKNFREFLAKYFVPEGPANGPEHKVAAISDNHSNP